MLVRLLCRTVTNVYTEERHGQNTGYRRSHFKLDHQYQLLSKTVELVLQMANSDTDIGVPFLEVCLFVSDLIFQSKKMLTNVAVMSKPLAEEFTSNTFEPTAIALTVF